MTIKNRIATILTVIAFTFGSGFISNINAQKIGHVNLNELVRSMPEFKKAQENLQKFQASLENEIVEMQKELEEKAGRLERDQADLTELVRQRKIRELQEMQGKIQEFMGEAQQNLEQQQEKELQPIYDKVEKAISAIARENTYTYILDSSQGKTVLFAGGGDDVAPLVKNQLGIN